MSGTTKSCLRVLGVALVAPLMLGQVCTPGGGQSSKVLVNQVVSVAGGGGFAQVQFNATSGQRIRITLTGAPNTMEPYGNLEYPDGNNAELPPNGAAVNGKNVIDVTLNVTGGYNLDVFDGANAGGSVTVRIELL
jgi:hypothetical protein